MSGQSVREFNRYRDRNSTVDRALDILQLFSDDKLVWSGSGGAIVCLDLEEAAHPVRISYERGHVVPVNAGAAAEVLLAWAPDQEVTDLLAAAQPHQFTSHHH
jgi:hypothetical protein